MFRVGRGLVGAAVTAQIGADDGVARRGQQRGDAVPGGVRTGMPVQEQHGGAAAAVPHAQPDAVVALAPRQFESVEHAASRVPAVEARLPRGAGIHTVDQSCLETCA